MASYEDEYDYLFKIVLVGDSTVGKSSLLSRFSEDKFSESQPITIGSDFNVRTIELEGKKIRTQIWDTAGQDRFRAIAAPFYRGANGALLVYDITRPFHHQGIEKWLEELRKYCLPDIEITLVGNKYDLRHLRIVTKEEAVSFANKNGLKFIETSASDCHNVEDAFKDIITRMYVKYRSLQREDFQIQEDCIKPRKINFIKTIECCNIL